MKALTPTVAEEGKNFQIDYVVKNIGKSVLPKASEIEIRIDQEISRYWRIKPLIFGEDLKPNEETKFTYFEKPLTKDFTWFHVNNAKSSDRNPVKVYAENESTLLFPLPFVTVNGEKKYSQFVLHGIRTRTIDEKNQNRALYLTRALEKNWSLLKNLIHSPNG